MATREVASQLGKAETKATGVGPVPGGDAAVAQSLLDKQNNLAAKIDDVTNKPAEEITKKDASELQSREDRVLNTGARTPASLAAQIQSQADHNAARKGSAGQTGGKSED